MTASAGYRLVAEQHTGTAGIPFLYAIRRRDGSLVFRTETLEYGETILRNLLRAVEVPA